MSGLETRAKMLFALAALVLAAGVASALLIRHARSSATRETIDLSAAGEAALSIHGNTASLSRRWLESGSSDVAALDIAIQECLGLLQGEVDRARELREQVQVAAEVDAQGSPAAVLEALSLLLQSQNSLAEALSEAREALRGLYPLQEGEARYGEARESFLAAIAAHNQALEASSQDFSSARQLADTAATALGKARTALESVSAEGLGLDAALSAISGLEKAVEHFIQACSKGESGDAPAHNELTSQVEGLLDAAPANLMGTIDIAGWMGASLAPKLEEVDGKLAEARDAIRAI